MRDLFEFIMEEKIPQLIFVLFLIIGGLFIMIRSIEVYGFQQVHVKVTVDENIVYDGVSAGVNVASGGRTTQVKIKGGFLYMFPKKIYVSENVRVEGEK